MRKANEDSRDPHLAQLAYRNTPVVVMPYSPAQLLMSRKLRDNRPTTEALLKPRVAEHAYVIPRERQWKAKAYFDRGTKKLSKLDRGDTVRIKSGRTWTPATVTEVHTSSRSYMVTTASGRVYRRNRKWLHKSSEPPPLTLMEDAGDDHTGEQYEQHGAPPPHNRDVTLCNQDCQQSVRLQTHQTVRGPKRQCLYESRADRNDHQFDWQTMNMLKQ